MSGREKKQKRGGKEEIIYKLNNFLSRKKQTYTLVVLDRLNSQANIQRRREKDFQLKLSITQKANSKEKILQQHKNGKYKYDVRI